MQGVRPVNQKNAHPKPMQRACPQRKELCRSRGGPGVTRALAPTGPGSADMSHNKKSREREEPKEHPKVGPHDDQSALLACGQCWQAGGAGCGPEAGVVPSFLTNSAGGRRREGRPGQTTARAGSKQLEPTPPQQPPLPPPPRWQRVCAPPTSSVHADICRARAGWGGRAAAAPAMQARLTTTKKRQQKSLGHGRRR